MGLLGEAGELQSLEVTNPVRMDIVTETMDQSGLFQPIEQNLLKVQPCRLRLGIG
jgi:hypothetical protein